MQLRLSMYSQHSSDQLNGEETPLEHILRLFPKDEEGKPHSVEQARSIVGRFGLTGQAQTMKISQLSDGQKARLVFATLSEQRPHFLLLDEPTNALDALTTQSLAEAINAWDGGVIIVSHDFALVSAVCKELWVCDHGLRRHPGDIAAYKKELMKKLGV